MRRLREVFDDATLEILGEIGHVLVGFAIGATCAFLVFVIATGSDFR